MELDDPIEESPPPTPPRFAMGVARHLTPHQRRQREREQRRRRFQKHKKGRTVSHSSFKICFPLTPSKRYDLKTLFTLSRFPSSSVKAVQHFHKIIAPPERPNFFSWKPEEIKTLSEAFYENIRARWSFRRLIVLFKVKRCKLVNETDPITLEPFQKPIDIYTLATKSIHRFEAKSLATAWRRNLLHHDGIFPEPRMPTNPLTNLSLTPLQIHMALKTMQESGHMNWVLDSFRACFYDLEKWQQKFGSSLKIESLESIFADKNSYDRYDMLMDFAELQFEYHGAEFPKEMFKWVFCAASGVPDYAEVWAKACKKFYVEKYSIHEKEDMEDLEIRTSILNAYLIEVPTIVKVIYAKYLENRNGRRRVQNRILVRSGNSIVPAGRE